MPSSSFIVARSRGLAALALDASTPPHPPTPPSGKLLVDGSFMTEFHLTALVGGAKRKWVAQSGRCLPTALRTDTSSTDSSRWANVSFWASELNNQNWGWKVVNGTCGGHYFKLGKKTTKVCEELTIAVKSSSATFTIDLSDGRSGPPPPPPQSTSP